MSAGARVEGGWLRVPLPDDVGLALVEVAVSAGRPGEGEWRPAGVEAGEALLRPPARSGVLEVWRRVSGVAERVGTIRLG